MQLEAAIASYDRAIAIKPDYAEAHYNRRSNLLIAERSATMRLVNFSKSHEIPKIVISCGYFVTGPAKILLSHCVTDLQSP